MGDKTGISWATSTWNPLVGCEHVSPGCDNCYAAREASGRLAHLPAYAGLASGGKFSGEVRLLPERLDQPIRWRKPRLIFTNSMADLFHKDVPDDYIAQVFAVMAMCPQHRFQVLTKRHARMRSLLGTYGWWANVAYHATFHEDRLNRCRLPVQTRADGKCALPNVWLGVSVENQQWADIRIPALLGTPATVRFVSAEPLLGPLDIERFLWDGDRDQPGGIGWLIAGGESGSKARPMHPAWARSLRDQCQDAGVPFHFKQWGEFAPSRNDEAWQVGSEFWPVWRYGKHSAGRELDGREWQEFPAEPSEVSA